MKLPKIMAFAVTLAILIFAQGAYAGYLGDECLNLSFVEEGFSLLPQQKNEIEFRLKNHSNQDFFIDLVEVNGQPEFLGTGKIVDKKIFEGFSGRVGATIETFYNQNERPVYAQVFVTGHFEGGNRCFVQKEFAFLLKANRKTSQESPGFHIFQQIIQIIIHPIESPPITPPINTQSQTVIISSYLSAVAFKEKATVWVVLENKSTEKANVLAGLQGLPEGIIAQDVQIELLPLEKKQVFLEVTGNTEETSFAGEIFIHNSGKVEKRPVSFENISVAENDENKGILQTAYVIFIGLPGGLLIIFAILALVLAIIPAKNHKKNKHPWVARN